MKKFVNILLAICIVALIYIVYGSIMNPIRFANEKNIRDKAVIQKLMDIKAAQTEYNYQHDGYCDNFDSLAAFIKTGKLPIVKKIGELTDDQLDNNWTEDKVLKLYAKAQTAEIEAAKLTGRRAAQKKYEADTLWQRAATEGFIEILEDGTKNFLFSRETEFVSLYDFDIIDTKKENGLPVHICKKLPQHPEAPMMACVDTDKRHACEANHTATHLVDEALREVLGTHVEQKGSLVTPDGLRFDFSHFQKVTDEELRQVERLVNEKIRMDLPLQEHRDLPIEEAKKLGAIALFGEKYGDKVRVVQFGNSIEFCGGVHASSTGRIGMFKIVSESSIAAGVRRIEAITGQAVEDMVYSIQDTIQALKAILPGSSIETAVKKAIDENATLKKQVEEFLKEKAAQVKERLISQAKDINGIKVISAVIPGSAAMVKDMVFSIRAEQPASTIVVIGSEEAGKPMLTVSVSEDLTSRFNAGQMVREAAKLIQGGGGGQPHFATAGGKNPDGLHAAVESLTQAIN